MGIKINRMFPTVFHFPRVEDVGKTGQHCNVSLRKIVENLKLVKISDVLLFNFLKYVINTGTVLHMQYHAKHVDCEGGNFFY